MTKAHQAAAEWTLLHGTGKCGEYRCRRIVRDELDLGLPKDPFQREEQYAERRALWQPLRDALDTHRWSFQMTECDECSETALCLTGLNKAACIENCLATAIPNFPTGHLQPWLYDLVDHSAKCISHSSSLTRAHLEALGKARMSSKTLRTELWESNSTSSMAPRATTPKTSSPVTASPRLALHRPKLQPFSIPKR